MKRTTMFQVQAVASTDRVVSGIWMPANSVLKVARGYIDFQASTIGLALDVFVGAASMWWLPVDDPDTTGTMDSVWDSQVLKDSVVVSLDLDTQSLRTNPEYEPGEAKWAKLFDVGVEVKHLWKEKFMSTLSRNAVAPHQDTETPFAYEFIPVGLLRPELPVTIRTSTPGLLAVGVSSPNLESP